MIIIGGAATFNNPMGIVVDSNRNILYVADKGNHAIRAIDLTNGK